MDWCKEILIMASLLQDTIFCILLSDDRFVTLELYPREWRPFVT